jgi:multicomponent Na+:H+ antiporter subunit G
MEFLQELISTVFLVAGAIFIMIASLGILRLPDFYVRMSAITKAGTMGVGLIAIGIAIYFNELSIAAKAFVVITFMLITAPVAAHIIARAAYRQGIPFWGNNLVDELNDIIVRRDLLENITVTEPNNIQAKIELVECYSMLPPIMGGSLKKAVLVASDIKDVNEAEGSRVLGQIYAHDKEFNLAEQEFVSAVNASGGMVKYRYELAIFYRNARMYTKALATFDSIYIDHPNEIKALFEYGKTSAESNLMFESGQQALLNYIQFLSEDENERKANAFFYLGIINLRQNMYPTALSYFEQSIGCNPNHKDSKFYLKKFKR